MNKQLTDEEIITAIRKDGRAGDAGLRQVYLQNREVVGRMVTRLQGTPEEAKDVMQEAVVAFLENVRNGNFKAESKISTYLFSIARFIWLNKRKKRSRETERTLQAVGGTNPTIPKDFQPTTPAGPEEMVRLFGRLGEDCRRVLLDSIYYGLNMRRIAEKMDYQNEQVARNKKYTCLRKLKEMVSEHPHLINWLNREE